MSNRSANVYKHFIYHIGGRHKTCPPSNAEFSDENKSKSADESLWNLNNTIDEGTREKLAYIANVKNIFWCFICGKLCI